MEITTYASQSFPGHKVQAFLGHLRKLVKENIFICMVCLISCLAGKYMFNGKVEQQIIEGLLTEISGSI